MAYRLLREFRQALTRLDTPPLSIRHHPGSAIASMRTLSAGTSALAQPLKPATLTDAMVSQIRNSNQRSGLARLPSGDEYALFNAQTFFPTIRNQSAEFLTEHKERLMSLKVETVFSVYAPPKADLPFLSVIIKAGREESPMVTSFATAAEAEAFNLEMGMELHR